MIGATRIRRTAAESGYREQIVEKVLYLQAIPRQLARHPDLAEAWALKGGTALNLFFLDVPRLSVDIDINYVGHWKLEAMQAARPVFEAALVACCQREGGGEVHGAPDQESGPRRFRRAPASGARARPARSPRLSTCLPRLRLREPAGCPAAPAC